jgi:predicted transcriptional regulator
MSESTALTPYEQRQAKIAGLLESIEDGKSLAEIAAEHGVSPQAISAFLLSNCGEKYKRIQEIGLIKRIVDADQKLEDASSHIEIARADRVCRYARWDAERRLPHMFATRSEISGPGGGPIELSHLERARRFAFLRAQAELETIDVMPDAVQHEERSLTELSTEIRPE